MINKVSIALNTRVYNTFRNLVNTIPNALGEYVDNAVKTSMTRLQEAGKLGDSLYVDSDGKLQLK